MRKTVRKAASRSALPVAHVEAATGWAKDVVAGKVLACKWVKLACQRHLDDLKRKDWPYTFDRNRAEDACVWMELFPHVKGQWAARREDIHLEPWQCFIVCSLFGWVNKRTKLRRFREAYVEISRKNGKSVLAALVGLRFFAAEGDFGAEVYSGATSEKQAWEIFRPARLMANRTTDFLDQYGVTVSASNLAILESGARFEPVIGSPGDGASPSCALVDEYHEHQTDSLYETMITGMGAREQPLAFIVTTAGANLSSPCYMKRQEVCKILERVVDDETTFALVFTLDDGDDWTTEEALRKANPNFGVSVSAEYLIERQRAAMRSARLQNSFKTKHLNLWVGAYTAWMNMLTWKNEIARKTLAELAGRPCFIGLDLATKIDIAAMILLFPPTEDDPLYHIHGRYYLPESVLDEKDSGNASHYDAWAKQGYLTLTPGNVIDYETIKEDLREFSSQFQVREVAFDPWQATQLASEMLAEGATMVEVRPTVRAFSEPMKQLEALVRTEKIAHGNCPVLTWMMSNVVARLDKKDNIYPVKEVSGNKIDGVVALLMALGRAIVQPQDQVSVYEERELVSI